MLGDQPPTPAGSAAAWLERLGVAAVVAEVAYLVVVALRLRVDYFDAYDSLLNARALADASADFSVLRSPLSAILLLPGALAAKLAHSPNLAFILSHLLAVAMVGLLLWSAFTLFRLHLQRGAALAGLLLLSWNVVLIGNAPLAKEDIPGTLFLTAAFLFYLKSLSSGRRRDLLVAGLLAGGAASVRYTLLPVPFIVIAGYELLQLAQHRFQWRDSRPLLQKVVFLFVLPVVVIFLVPTVVYVAVHRATLLGAPARFVNDLLLLRKVANAFNEDAFRNYRFLVEAVGWPVLLAVLAGVVASIRRRRRIALFFGLWFLAIFVLQTYAIVHKEVRYLLPALPPLYWFAAAGLEAIWPSVLALLMRARATLAGPRLRVASVAALLVAVAVVGLPASGAVFALVRFQDPVYTQDYERQVSRYALSLAGSGPITWVGPYYALHPRDFVFDRQDPYTYVFHFYAHVVRFWIGRGVTGASAQWPTIDELRDGEVLILNPSPQLFDTGNMPKALPPLTVERLTVQVFRPQGAGMWKSASGATIHATGVGSGWQVDGDGLQPGRYDLFVGSPDPAQHSLTAVTVQGSTFQAHLDGPTDVESIALLRYDAARAFPLPGSGG
jgi:hypothetical protein